MSRIYPDQGAVRRRKPQPGARRKGVTIVYVAMLLVVLLGMAAYALDLSYLYMKKAQCQRAADAAALAGAFEKAQFRSGQAFAKSAEYAGKAENGGYVNGVNGCIIKYAPVLNADGSVTYLKNEQGITQETWYRVDIARPERTFFGQIFGIYTVKVGAYATALYETLQEIPIKGIGTYGVAPGPVNLSLFGPDGFYNNGDYLSVKKNASGGTNTYYTGKGYDFTVKIPPGTGQTTVDIFDPDCYNKDDQPDAAEDVRVDEYRNAAGGGGSGSSFYNTWRTQTEYSLYSDNGTPDPADDILIGKVKYGINRTADMAADMKWNECFDFDRDAYPANVQFRLNVTSTAGASENGFDLRAGPKRVANRKGVVPDFDPNNGSTISGQGRLPMNFNTSGTVTISLGSAPREAAGGTMTVRNFDTDVGSKSIVYKCSVLPGWSSSGSLSGQGTFASDTFTIPDDYYTAGPGVWTATYTAGLGDTSVWDMTYSNGGQGKPGPIKLIR